jgi:hypothetical protein
MQTSPQPPPNVNPDPTPSSYLAVAPSRATCPRRVFPTRLDAEAWARRMSCFYSCCYSVFRVDGNALTLEILQPPPRYGEGAR